jgi:hypothetical protein
MEVASYSGMPAHQDGPGPITAGEFDIPEQGPSEPLMQCSGCGRSFNAKALEKHAKVCKKVFQDKRKQFDSAAERLGDFENAQQLIKGAKKIEREARSVKEKEESNIKDDADSKKPIPAWKQKSLAFRNAMLAAKAASNPDDQEAQAKAEAIKKELGAAGPDPDKVICPHCGRSFNKESGERHIAICLRTFGGKARAKSGAGKGPGRGGASSGPSTRARPQR